MVNRVFFASTKDIGDWGRRRDKTLGAFKEDDILFIVLNERLTKSQKEFLEELKKRSKTQVCDVENNNAVATVKNLLKSFLNKEKENRYKYDYYIIGRELEDVFYDKSEFGSDVCILYHDNFLVSRIKSNYENKQKISEQDSQMDLFNSISQQFDDSENIQKKNKKISEEERKAEEEFIKQTIMKTKKESNLASEKQKERIRRKANSEMNSFGDENGKPEDKIFLTEIKTEEYNEEYSLIDDAKATLCYLYQKRIESHVKKMLFRQKEAFTLTEKQLFVFLKIMLIVDSAEEFNDSWAASESSPKIQLKELDYSKLKEEVLYYDKMTSFMYGEDKWS